MRPRTQEGVLFAQCLPFDGQQEVNLLGRAR
jgi:hypothetical protein